MISVLRRLILSFWLICLCSVAAPEQSTPLPVDQAFPLKVWMQNLNTVIVEWDIQPGYYLYKDRIHITAAANDSVRLGNPEFPPSIEHSSPILGKFAAFEGQTQVRIPLIEKPDKEFSLQIQYQGCAAKGYCYPPQIRMMTVAAGGIDLIPKSSSAPAAVKGLKSHPLNWMVWLGFFGLGLLISFTPCVLPMVPILFGLIVGKEHITHTRAFLISLAYVLGMAITYALVGLLFGLLGSSIQVYFQKPIAIILLSLIFIVMALSLWGVFQFEPPEKWRSWVARLSNHQRRGSIWGALTMGILSTLILSPCATPALVGVLAYISQTGNVYLGCIALGIVGIGSGVPLLLIGAFGRRLLPKTGAWMRFVEHLLGILLMGMGIFMLSRILPPRITLVLWAVLAVGVSVYLKTFQNTSTRMQLIGKGVGILVFIYGVLLLVGAAQGSGSLLTPLLLKPENCSTMSSTHFISVKSSEDVAREMNQAVGKPVILDFYADWCVSCKIIEKRVFQNPEVLKQLSGFLWLRADITHNDAADQKLMHDYEVIAPPTILLFNPSHQEISQERVVGEISAAEFLQRINQTGSS